MSNLFGHQYSISGMSSQYQENLLRHLTACKFDVHFDGKTLLVQTIKTEEDYAHLKDCIIEFYKENEDAVEAEDIRIEPHLNY